MKKPLSLSSLAPALSRYHLTAGAALAAVASVPMLHGDVVYFNGSNAFTVSGIEIHDWDINGDATNDFAIIPLHVDITYIPDSNAILAMRQNAANAWVKAAGSINGNLLHLTPGVDQVGPSLAANRFGNSEFVVFGRDTQSLRNFGGLIVGTQDVGFRFNVGGQTDYGWANITLVADATSIRFNDWAYDTTGGAIVVGSTTPIPEPADTAAGLGLLALGAVGVAVYRKRKLAAA